MSHHCDLCDRWFPDPRALEQHKEASSLHKRHCDLCDKLFPHPQALEQHEEASARHKRYCEECGKEFSTERGLKEHFVQSPRHAYCQYCNEHFEDQDELENHYDEEHHYCPLCSKVCSQMAEGQAYLISACPTSCRYLGPTAGCTSITAKCTTTA
ncbi:hypothetical protein BDW22DRAFT_333394 [Trametopsis cervina]|nr:hypothetical protein BDW22DRAFT_333394 [Trametopsis cervina]